MKTKSLLLAVLISLVPSIAYAIDPPTIDPVHDAVDASTLELSGTTEPEAQVVVTGGTAEIPPVIADSNGKFSLKVGLAQETLNSFSITAAKDGETSEAVNINVIEGKEEAQAYSEEHGVDVIAPDAPEIDPYTSPVNADTIMITGSAEAGAKVSATTPDNTTLAEVMVSTEGLFSICVPLTQNQTNRINFAVVDSTGNTSLIIQELIEETDTGTLVVFDQDECGKPPKKVEAPVEEEEEDDVPDGRTPFIDETDIAPPFTDIAGHWAEQYIEKLRLLMILTGRKPGIFSPDDTVTRAELVKIALKAFDYQLYSPEEMPFADVDLLVWYTPYISKARDLNLVQGYANNIFAPDQQISRVEALKILLAAAGFNIGNTTNGSQFPDIDLNAWYIKYLAFALDNNIVNGYADGTFRPHAPITRAEISKITAILLDLVETLPTTKMKEAEIEEEEDKIDDVVREEELTVTDEGDNSEEADESFVAPEFSEETQDYVHTFYKFKFSFNTNWWYDWPGGMDGDIATVILSDKDTRDEDFTNDDILVKVRIIEGTLDEMGVLDGAEILEGSTFTIFKNFDEDSHIEITGNEALSEEIRRIGSTLELNINPDDFITEEEEL